MRQAVILVGGRGTRLGDLARDVPKPLMPIAGDARFLDYLIANIARHGVKDIVLLAGHLAELVEQRYAGARFGDAAVRVIVEPAPAGTGGALQFAADVLDDAFLMSNGDSFFDMNYLRLTQKLRGNTMGVLALRRVEDAARYGRVEASGDRVVAFHEKDASFKGSALISAGVYALRRDVLSLIQQTPASIETDIFPALAAQGRLAAVESEGYFIDIGLPETLMDARATLAARMRRGAVFFDRDGTLNRDDDGYTFKPEALHWQPGAIDAIRAVNDSGRLAIVVTNQSGVARGYYTEAQVAAFHAHMQTALHEHGAHIDAFYHCPHHRDGTVAAFAHADHPDRKPRPGMLRRALTEWPIVRGASFMVGDAAHDVEAARAVGIDARLVRPGELLAAVKQGLTRTAADVSPLTAFKQNAAAARAWLFERALPIWWERGFDGAVRCFHERIGLDGVPVSSPRRIRVQARQTIVYARAGRLGWDGPWRAAASAGLDVLLQRGLHDEGGTRHLLDENGAVSDSRRDLYDLAFVLFALSEAGAALKRDDALDAARGLADWAHDNWADTHGGFREGEIDAVPPRRQNPHMHMFEALQALHAATGDAPAKERGDAIAALFRDKLFDERHGVVTEFFEHDWRPCAGDEGRVVEPGHLFEWSWLLNRWRAAGGVDLGARAERLRVHGEVYGVDLASGAVYDETFADGRAHKTTSRLWPHTERIKANLARFERTHDPTALEAANDGYRVLMDFCATPTPGLWYDARTPDGVFVQEPARASSFYHIMFALEEMIRVAATLD